MKIGNSTNLPLGCTPWWSKLNMHYDEGYVYTLTGDSVWRQGKERDLLCVRLGCGNWLWCRRFLISSLWWIIADGCHKVHVFWETFNPGRKSGMGYYLLFILMGNLYSSGSVSNCGCSEKCIPYKVSRNDICSKLSMWNIKERSVHCWGSVCGCNHDS